MATINGTTRFYMENPAGDRTILIDNVRSELLNDTTPANRIRLDVSDSVVSQRLAPTPITGRNVLGIPKHFVPQNGFLVVALKNDAAGTLVSASATTVCRVGIIVRDLTRQGTPWEFRVKQLQASDRSTARVADNPVGSTTAFVDFMAFLCPTGQEWMLHGEQNQLWSTV